MKVALVALLAPSVALAFTPADLRGVWHCVPHDGFKMDPAFDPPLCLTGGYVDNGVTTLLACNALNGVYFEATSKCYTGGSYSAGSKAACDAVAGLYRAAIPESYVPADDDDASERVVVFDANSKATRRLSGRTYYMNRGDTYPEEHDFHGIMMNAVEGSFYLDPNTQNTECNSVGLSGPTTAQFPSHQQPAGPAYTDKTLAGDDYILRIEPNIAAVPTTDYGSCWAKAKGPFTFEFSDIDHFTLTLDRMDMQQDNYQVARKPLGLEHNHEIPRIHVVEKCMRGLPQGSELCAMLRRSKITSQEDQNRACAGALECAQSSSTQQWGCNGKKCCSVRGYTQPTYNYPQYQYPSYYPQPSYGNYGGYGGYGGFWG
jgi:hypothetical protein